MPKLFRINPFSFARHNKWKNFDSREREVHMPKKWSAASQTYQKMKELKSFTNTLCASLQQHQRLIGTMKSCRLGYQLRSRSRRQSHLHQHPRRCGQWKGRCRHKPETRATQMLKYEVTAQGTYPVHLRSAMQNCNRDPCLETPTILQFEMQIMATSGIWLECDECGPCAQCES